MRARWVAVGGALAVAVALWLSAPAGAAVYWTTWSSDAGWTIARANSDGTSVNTTFIQVGVPRGLAAGCRHLYWSDHLAGRIGRANLDGTGVRDDLVTGLHGPRGVAVTDEHIYWAADGGFGRADLDGENANPLVMSGPSSYGPRVAVDDTHLYWAHPGGIGRATLDGSDASSFIEFERPFEPELAVNARYIYWTHDFGRIGRARLDGTILDDDLIPSAHAVTVAVDDAHLYWGNTGSIGRADLDGSNPRHGLVPLGAPFVFAVDRTDCAAPSRHRRPFVDSVRPASGSTRGGDTIILRGENFSDGTGVLFDDTPASSVHVVNHTTLRVQTPAHAAGGYRLTVVNENGRSPRDSAGFTFVDP